MQDYFRDSLRFVFRHFLLTEVHPLAGIAAESAEFAGAAGLFWEMHDALFENQIILSISTIFTNADKNRLPKILLRNALETARRVLWRSAAPVGITPPLVHYSDWA